MLFAWGLVSDIIVCGKAVCDRCTGPGCFTSAGFNPNLEQLLQLFHASDLHSVACSWSCIWCLYKDGRVYQQQLHQHSVPLASPQLVPCPRGTIIKQLSTGEGHCLALCEAGNLWCWGDNSSGQCGAPAPPHTSNTSTQSAGQGHVGYGSHSSQALPDSVTNPLLILGPGAQEEHARCKVLQCAAGAKHSCAITSGHPPPSPHSGGQPLPPTTHCFCWGWNGHGQCGTSLSDARSSRPGDISQPWLVPQLEGVQLTAVAAGLAHTVVLSSDGAAYALGWNNRGQLGAGVACAGSSCPLLVEGSQLDHAHLVQVACGSWHTLVCAADGQVFAWGWNAHGQCCTTPAAAAPTRDAATSGSGHQQQAVAGGESGGQLQPPEQKGDGVSEGAADGGSSPCGTDGPGHSTDTSAVLQSIWGAAAAPDGEACVWQPTAVDLSSAAAAAGAASSKEQSATGTAAGGCITTSIVAGGWHSLVWLQPGDRKG